MFKEIGNVMGMLKDMPRIMENMKQLGEQVAKIQVEGDAGAGMVKVCVNGKLEVISVQIANEALTDKELLEDLLRSATNQAIKKAQTLMTEEARKLAGGFSLPPGFQLPT